MVKSCSVLGCRQRYSKEAGVSFHRFPADLQIKDLWIKALARHNWQPSNHSLVCGKHFITGRPSADPQHPDFVPNVFPHISMHHMYRTSYAKRLLLINVDAATQVPKVASSTQAGRSSDCEKNGDTSTDDSCKSREKRSNVNCPNHGNCKKRKNSLPRRYIPPPRKTVPVKDPVREEQLTAENSTDGSASTSAQGDNELLLLQCRIDQHTQLQEEMRKQLQKQQNEINLLQVQVEMLREKNTKLSKEPKHTSRDVMAEAFLLDKNRCSFYTGIPNNESFLWLLHLLETELQKSPFKIPTSKQLLITLMKIKFDFQHIDLGYRFGVAPSTVCKILKTWMPLLINTLITFLKNPEDQKNLILDQLLDQSGNEDISYEEQRVWPEKILSKAMSFKSKTLENTKESESAVNNLEFTT